MAAGGKGAPASDLCFLVAEDHEFQRSMIVQMLEHLGASGVYEAEDGRAAMEITRELDHPFDIIVTDIDMPGMDGMSFIRHLGEAGVNASLIITSSLDRPLLDTIETMSAAYGMRLLGIIEKPLTQGRLVNPLAQPIACPLAYHLVYHETALLAPANRCFRDWLLGQRPAVAEERA